MSKVDQKRKKNKEYAGKIILERMSEGGMVERPKTLGEVIGYPGSGKGKKRMFEGGLVEDPDKQDEDLENMMANILRDAENPHEEFPELQEEEKEERKGRGNIGEYLRKRKARG